MTNTLTEMKAEGEARGAYFAATQARAISIGAGSATQEQFDEMVKLKKIWQTLRNS